MTVPVVAVRGRQLVQFRLVPDEHVLDAGRPVVRTAGGRRRRRRRYGTSADQAAAAATAAAAAARTDSAAAERRILILLLADDHAHAGHEADDRLFLLGLGPASVPSAAGHQRGPPPDDGLPLLPPNPSPPQRIGQPSIAVHCAVCVGFTQHNTRQRYNTLTTTPLSRQP